MSHSVDLASPLSVVWPALSDSWKLATLQGLTPEAQKFTLLSPDNILLPAGGLQKFFTPNHPIAPAGLHRPNQSPTYQATSTAEAGLQSVPRANFVFSGTTPLLFGLINSPLEVAGSQIVDEEGKVVLFESTVAAQAIRELKVRTFEEIDDGNGTRVTETVWGECPWYMTWFLQMIAPGVHREHMELYWKLFE